jgi:hypothetical protein
MTTLEPTPNAAFWQALEAYLSRRIVEEVATEPVKVTEEEIDPRLEQLLEVESD